MTPPPCPAEFEWIAREAGWTLVCRALEPRHGWTTRGLALPGADEPGSSDWPRLATDAGLAPERIVRLRQVHGADVVEARTGLTNGGRAADALVSRDPGVLLTVRVADCVPLLIADRSLGAVAAVHAGWRGTGAGVAQRAVEAMIGTFGCRVADLAAALGPSIGPCCYEVGSAVRDALQEAGWSEAAIQRWFTGPLSGRLNLWRANQDQLIEAGLDVGAVFTSGLCTACHAGWFHSYRREKERAGRMAAYIRAAAAPP